MIYRVFAAVALIVVVVATIVLGGQQNEITATTTIEQPPHDVGYAARKATLVETGPDGNPLYTLIAQIIRQLPKEGVVELEQVQLGFHDTSGNQWNARAQHGELGQDSGKVELSGDVQVAGVLPGMQQPATITTDRLSFDTHTQVVSTDDPVTILWSGHQLESRGLLANLKDQRLRLESAVHGIFKP
jgi:LPS export ABC transporter protein LptC